MKKKLIIITALALLILVTAITYRYITQRQHSTPQAILYKEFNTLWEQYQSATAKFSDVLGVYFENNYNPAIRHETADVLADSIKDARIALTVFNDNISRVLDRLDSSDRLFVALTSDLFNDIIKNLERCKEGIRYDDMAKLRQFLENHKTLMARLEKLYLRVPELE